MKVKAKKLPLRKRRRVIRKAWPNNEVCHPRRFGGKGWMH